MMARHPRWYELVEMYGNPIDMVNLKQEGTNIASTSAKIKLKYYVNISGNKAIK